MNIRLITPSAKDSRSGNQTTAVRWKNILASLGHHVDVSQSYSGENADLMIALHAWRSAEAIRIFSETFPDKPLIVALTGTDVYQFLHTHREQTLQSIEYADRLVGLHDYIATTLPKNQQAKVRIIYQSIQYKPKRKKHCHKRFKVCVAGHLRNEKDSLRVAYASRKLPKFSKILISHYGKAHNLEWYNLAKREMIKNKRYRWHGEISQALLHHTFQNSHLLALPSNMEGGANVVSEAIVIGLPVITSDIEGSIGLLGKNYPGYFKVGNTTELRSLLLRCEKDSRFYQSLARAGKTRRNLFRPEREKSSWRKLLLELQ